MSGRGISIQQFSDRTGADLAAIRKWFAQEGVEPIRTKQCKNRVMRWFDEKRGLAVIVARRGNNALRNGTVNLDPETGLTWHQRKERAEALAKERENEIAEKTKSEEWVSAEFMHNKFSNFCIALEQIPGKLKSESGLTDKQALAVRRAIDEARESAAKGIEKEEEQK